MSIKTKINSLEKQVTNGEVVSLVHLTELEEELNKSNVKNKNTLKRKLFLLKQQLYPTKTPTKWEIFLTELSLKKNIEPVMSLAKSLENSKNLKLSLEEINKLERQYEVALEYLNNPNLFTEKEKEKTIREFQKKLKIFHNRLATEIDSEFCAYLKQVRLEKGLSLKNLEDITGISSSHIHRIENNNRKPSIRVIEKLSQALDIPSEQFLEKMNLMVIKRELLDIIDENQFLVNGRSLSNKENVLFKKHVLNFFKTKEDAN